jgi:hypothetical protein
MKIKLPQTLEPGTIPWERIARAIALTPSHDMIEMRRALDELAEKIAEYEHRRR